MKIASSLLGKSRDRRFAWGIAMAGLAAVGLLSFLQAADLELENERGWNQAREAYFRIASDPIQPYRMEAVVC